MNQIIQLLTQILMLVEQLVQRQDGTEVNEHDYDKSLEHKILREQRANPCWAGYSKAVTEDESLSSPHEFMGSRSKQWSQRYKGLLMDFEGAQRHIEELRSKNAELKLQYESAIEREEEWQSRLRKLMKEF